LVRIFTCWAWLPPKGLKWRINTCWAKFLRIYLHLLGQALSQGTSVEDNHLLGQIPEDNHLLGPTPT
jgi:hypothetical protein